MKRRGSAAAAAAMLAIAAGGWVMLHDSSAPPSSFVLLDGTQASTADLQGKVTLVSFWSTSCNVCVSDMDRLLATYQRYHGQGFETLAIALGSDSPADVALYSETRRLPFRIAIDASGSLAKAWGGVDAAPTTFLVDRGGTIVKRYVGAPDFDELQRLIARLLRS